MPAACMHMILLVSLLLPGKEPTRVVHRQSSFGTVEVFTVLRSDTSVRHGAYKLNILDKPRIRGFYLHGLRDSTWTFYGYNGKVLIQGLFKNGQLTGIWEFFDKEGVLEQKIDYGQDHLLYYRTRHQKTPFKIISGKDTLVTILDRPPLYLGGTSRIEDFINSVKNPPLHKAGVKSKGIVYIRFLIDSTGHARDHCLLKGMGKMFDEEALRVVKSLPEEWLPGVFEGRFVSVEYILTVMFEDKPIQTGSGRKYYNPLSNPSTNYDYFDYGW